MNKKLFRIPLGFVLVGSLAGCPGETTTGGGAHDLKGIEYQDPQKAEMYTNVDGYPNIVRLCIGGVAFATTTRPDFTAVIRVPEWDASFCGTPAK